MPKPTLDEIFSGTRPSLNEIFQEKPKSLFRLAGESVAKDIVSSILPSLEEPPTMPIIEKMPFRLAQRFFEKPISGLRGIAKEGLPGFEKGMLEPEKYPIGTFAEAYQKTFPKMSPIISGVLGTIADAGYYFGMPEIMTRIATAGKVKLLEGVVENINTALKTANETRTGVVEIPKETLNTIAQNKDIGTVVEAYIKSKGLKIPRTTGLLEFKPTAPEVVPKALLTIKPSIPITPKALLPIRPTLPEIFEAKVPEPIPTLLKAEKAPVIEDLKGETLPTAKGGEITQKYVEAEEFLKQSGIANPQKSIDWIKNILGDGAKDEEMIRKSINVLKDGSQNPKSQKAFEMITGVKLPKIQKEAQVILEKMSNLSPLEKKWMTEKEVKDFIIANKGKSVVIDDNKSDWKVGRKVRTSNPDLNKIVGIEDDYIVYSRNGSEFSRPLSSIRDFVIDGKSQIGDLKNEEYARPLFVKLSPKEAKQPTQKEVKTTKGLKVSKEAEGLLAEAKKKLPSLSEAQTTIYADMIAQFEKHDKIETQDIAEAVGYADNTENWINTTNLNSIFDKNPNPIFQRLKDVGIDKGLINRQFEQSLDYVKNWLVDLPKEVRELIKMYVNSDNEILVENKNGQRVIKQEGLTKLEDISKKYIKTTGTPQEKMAQALQITMQEAEPEMRKIPGKKERVTAIRGDQKQTIEYDYGTNILTQGKKKSIVSIEEYEERKKGTIRQAKAQGTEIKITDTSTPPQPKAPTSREGFILQKAFQPSEWITALDDIWYKSLGKKLETSFFGLLNKITPEVVKRNIVEAYGQPMSYQRLVDMLAADRAKNTEVIKNISLKISQFKPEEVKNIRQYIESGNYPDTPLGQTAREVEDIFFDLGKQLVRYGLLKPGQFAKYADKYFPHYYKIFEKDGAVTRWFRRRLDLSYAKHRTEPSEELKEAMGIIDDSPAPVARKMISEMGDISLQRFFETISQNPELASPIPIGDFKQLPKNKKLGFLSEMYVHPSITDDLQGMVYVPQLADSIMTKMLSLWKTGKVVLNPPTVGRNIITNFFMADVIGRVPSENVATWIQGAMSLKNRDKYYQLLRNQGKIGVEFYRGEIEDILNTFPSEGNPIKVMLTVLKKVGDYYSALEEWAKVTIFRKNVEDGMGVVEAAQLAEDAIFNYSKVSPLVRQLRQGRGQGPLGQAGTIFASPFITFKAKAIKGLSHATFKRPFSLLKYVLLFSAIGAMAKKALDISDEKYKEMQSSMEERGRYGLLIPLKDEDNSYYMLDLTFMLPVVGDYLEMKSIASKKGILPAVQRATGIFGNPFVNIPAELVANKDFYSQREIYNELDLPSERLRKQLEFIYQQSVPPLAPFGGGYRLLEKQELPKKLLTLGGLRLLRYNEDEETDRQLRQLKNIDFQFNMENRRLLKDTRLSDIQKEKKMGLLFKGYERKKELLLK